MNQPSYWAGWLQLAGGVAAIVLEVISALRGHPINTASATVGASLAAGGAAHVLGKNGR